MLRTVARVYRALMATGRPAQALAELFDVSDRTARWYIQRARAAGHLGEALSGKAGEKPTH